MSTYCTVLHPVARSSATTRAMPRPARLRRDTAGPPHFGPLVCDHAGQGTLSAPTGTDTRAPFWFPSLYISVPPQPHGTRTHPPVTKGGRGGFPPPVGVGAYLTKGKIATQGATAPSQKSHIMPKTHMSYKYIYSFHPNTVPNAQKLAKTE